MEIALDYRERLNADRDWAWVEADAYFAGQSQIWVAIELLFGRLKELDVPYALGGVLAMFLHGYRRFTENAEVSVTPEVWHRIEKHLLGNSYSQIASSRTLKCHSTGVKIAVSLDPNIRVATELIQGVLTLTLVAIIDDRLISGRTPGRRRLVADVQDLIIALKLPEVFVERLEPSVQPQYLDLWRAVDSAPPHLLC